MSDGATAAADVETKIYSATASDGGGAADIPTTATAAVASTSHSATASDGAGAADDKDECRELLSAISAKKRGDPQPAAAQDAALG